MSKNPWYILLCFSEVPQSCIVSPSWSTRLLVLGLVGTGWLMLPRGCRCLVFHPLRVQIDPRRASRCSSMPKLPSHVVLLLIRSTRMVPGRRCAIVIPNTYAALSYSYSIYLLFHLCIILPSNSHDYAMRKYREAILMEAQSGLVLFV